MPSKTIFLAILFCLICSFPAFYYIFILDINFLTAGTPGATLGETISLDFNLSNKILIISSIIFFQLTPFLISKNFLNKMYFHAKKHNLYSLIFTVKHFSLIMGLILLRWFVLSDISNFSKK